MILIINVVMYAILQNYFTDGGKKYKNLHVFIDLQFCLTFLNLLV